ncbi:MAG: hypothetical protein JNL79_25245 [Myxococcales bacterium]|nr:hypothetical protein [Myxococcales bacterium]
MDSALVPPPEGRFELEPRDVTVAEWSRAPLPNIAIVAVVSVGRVVLGYVRTKEVQPGLVWSAIAFTTLVTLGPSCTA